MHKLSYYTKLGNSLVQLSNAINVAKEDETRLIVPVEKDRNDKEAFSYLKNVPNYNFGDNALRGFLTSKFYFDTQTFGHTMNNDKRRMILQQYVLPHIPFVQEDLGNTLVIHIRSGDIFNEWVHENYVQPPLTYYKKIIEESNTSDILIVTQKDKSNPCVDALLQWNDNIKIQTGTLEEDVNTILSAKNLVIGFGTWGWALSLMSPNLEKLWCPKVCTDILNSNFENEPYIIKRYDFLNYIKMGDWKCTEEQKNIMIGDVDVVQIG